MAKTTTTATKATKTTTANNKAKETKTMKKATATTKTTATNVKKVQASITSNKVNFGILKDDKHKDVLKKVSDWKNLRDQMAKDQENRKNDLALLQGEDAFKGNLIDKTWICLDKDNQVEYNLREDKIRNKYRELAKKRKEDLHKIYEPLFGNSFFESYLAYMAVGSGSEEKEKYLKEVETFLKIGIRVPFGTKGLRFMAEELVKGIGKQVLGLRAAYRMDQDAIPYTEAKFYDAVMANFRSILQEKNVIAVNPIEVPKKKKEPATESPKEKQPLKNLPTEEILEKVSETAVLLEEPKTKKVRNRGTRKVSKTVSKSKSENEIGFAFV